MGNRFTLTTWRRDGLIARLRARTFTVATLDDALDALPVLPSAPAPGELLPRTLASGDAGAASTLRATVGRRSALTMVSHCWHLNTPLRRRKSRGAADFYHVTRDGAQAGIVPLSEQDALLMAYAQVQPLPPLALVSSDGIYRLPAVELPPPQRALLKRIGEPFSDGWRVDAASLPFVRRLLVTLGIVIKPA
ncbi:hypothetical protein HC891_08370 [Candidatus Gracilibacteria bacterium]|nr:hypothetical protein [Candidatus Gracilibacteria bacterium]